MRTDWLPDVAMSKLSILHCSAGTNYAGWTCNTSPVWSTPLMHSRRHSHGFYIIVITNGWWDMSSRVQVFRLLYVLSRGGYKTGEGVGAQAFVWVVTVKCNWNTYHNYLQVTCVLEIYVHIPQMLMEIVICPSLCRRVHGQGNASSSKNLWLRLFWIK